MGGFNHVGTPVCLMYHFGSLESLRLRLVVAFEERFLGEYSLLHSQSQKNPVFDKNQEVPGGFQNG